MTAPSTHNALMERAAGGGWLVFRHPVAVFSTQREGDVLPALRELENAVERRGRAAIICLTYEAAPAFDSALKVRPGGDYPLLWAALYPGAEEADVFEVPADGDWPAGWMPTVSEDEYRVAIRRIKEEIRNGSTYQVNYTYRLGTQFLLDPFRFFSRLSHRQRGCSAYVDTGRYVHCSFSPELFFELDGRTIISRPMKGTARRGRFPGDDRVARERLQASEKERAENVMIVDMVRNDLGRIAETGSVKVRKLCTTEKYPTVWQMTSTVGAHTTAGLPDILQALFPPASITGAPKASSMEIIAALETTPRRIYTGTIGYLLPGRRMRFNVAIRTALVDRAAGRAEYGVGGGIVWASDESSELEEARLKAGVLMDPVAPFSLLETMLWTRAEGYHRVDRHLARLELSAEYFDYPFDRSKTLAALASAAEKLDATGRRVRVLLSPGGRVSIETTELPQPTALPARVCLAPRPVSPEDIHLYHKTTNRRLYDRLREECPEYDDVILWNESGEITESTIANIALDFGDRILTPPVSSGLLPGVFRSTLLDSGKISEHVLTKDDLVRALKVLFMNSLRGVYPVIVAGTAGPAGGVDTPQDPSGRRIIAPAAEPGRMSPASDRVR